MIDLVRSIRLFVLILIVAGTAGFGNSNAQNLDTPPRAKEVVSAFEQVRWREIAEGFAVLRIITSSGLVATAYRFLPEKFSIELALQSNSSGSRARDIGEREGAIFAINAGFFAKAENGNLYSIGYLRKDGNVLSKGWQSAGGVINFKAGNSISLSPSHAGIPKNSGDALQSRPMLIEPGGRWAMSRNLADRENRSILCRRANSEVIFIVISRLGLSLYEAGWILRDRNDGGYFGCDSAIALDGGSSTQVWVSGEQQVSYSGLSPVHNFLVARFKAD
ncbi:MAG: phosphodiester glycosidase family protein [Pseudomonadota bacterium]